MKKVIVIYDDSVKPNKEIKSVTGDKSYGETIFKRVTLKNRMTEEIKKNKQVRSVLFYDETEDVEKLKEELINEKNAKGDTSVALLFSNFGIADSKDFQNLLSKAAFINSPAMALCEGNPAIYLMPSIDSFLENEESLHLKTAVYDEIDASAFTDLSKMNHFLSFITGGFDARFFNALAGDEYTVTKKSTKIEKIKAEYNFYYLLPDNMKMWFVMPYDYKETKEMASYTMERFHMTDIAIRYVHGAVSTEELSDILEKLFYFINLRKSKASNEKEVKEVANDLYLTKLRNRMEDLKKLKEYKEFDQLIAMGTQYESIDAIMHKYEKLYQQITQAYPEKENQLVIGHGDLCFSNILYSREAQILKLIDPKGALKEEEMYTDVYYDLAKLSHSICGLYDFFNSGLYQVTMDRDMKLHLSIDADADEYIEIFKGYLEKNGFSYVKVRLYEASLFLSMLPYHMDQPGKVFGFIMNAIRILEEVEKCTKI